MLYLIRHGQALQHVVDAERPLSARGEADIARLARFLTNSGVQPRLLLHSGLRRAAQTAQLLAAALGGEVRCDPGIGPLEPVGPFIGRLADLGPDVIVCSHMPFLGDLASTLLCNAAESSGIAISPGTMLCLDRKELVWTMRWMLPPAVLLQQAATNAETR